MCKRNLLLGMGILLISISCSNKVDVVHCGKRNIDQRIVMLDSFIVNADTISGRGNFFMQDSSIYFADSYYMSIFQYDLTSLSCVNRYLNKGQGPNELSSFLYAYPFKKGDGDWFLIDNSLGMYTYRKEDKRPLTYKGRLNFGWDNLSKDNYDSPSVYNLMEMTDFGIDFTCLNDSSILIPISLVNRNLNNVSKKRYAKGHVFAEVNTRSMEVKNVFGHFPQIYKERPNPFFEFFQYEMVSDTLYINHAADSLIYVYKYPDELLYTIGYECSGINRNYTKGYEVEMAQFKKDILSVGLNTGLLYVKEKQLLFRTVLKNFNSREVCLQAYSNNDLVLEADVPGFFKLLGFWNSYFYGVDMLPKEKEDGMNFVFYRFKIENT